jgi:hypothetical protein
VEETISGIQIQIKQPHLISVRVRSAAECNETMNKTSIKIYPLKMGRTTIGSAVSNDIVIEGAGVEAEHCFVENTLVTVQEDDDENSSSSFSSSATERVSLVTLFPIGRLCAVDDVLVDAPFLLHSGMCFIICFIFIQWCFNFK